MNNYGSPSGFIVSGSIAAFVRDASEAPLRPTEQDQVLADRMSTGDPEALEALVRPHLRIVIDEAIRVRGQGRRQAELIKLGAEALVRSARRYSAPRHGPFSDYARATVREAIGRTVDGH